MPSSNADLSVAVACSAVSTGVRGASDGQVRPREGASERWWWELVRCPQCGMDPDPGTGPGGACAGCGMPFSVDRNVARFPSEAPEASSPRAGKTFRDYLSIARYRLDPFASPYSPLTWLSRWRIEQYYRRSLEGRELAEAWAAHHLEGVALPATATALDHGCGRGRVSAFLHRLGHRVVGQDVVGHPWWDRLPEVGFAVVPGRMPYLPWRAGSFDLVLNSMVIGHLSAEQLRRQAEGVFEILKPGGTWVIYEANSTGIGVHVNRQYYGRLHSLDDVLRLAAEIGWVESRVTFHHLRSPVFPRAISYLTTHLSPRGFDISPASSPLEAVVPPRRRAMWLLRLRRP
jgi:SAM-dependent methyltransferase